MGTDNEKQNADYMKTNSYEDKNIFDFVLLSFQEQSIRKTNNKKLNSFYETC